MKQSSNWLLVKLDHKKKKSLEVEVPQVTAAPISADVPDAKGEPTPATN